MSILTIHAAVKDGVKVTGDPQFSIAVSQTSVGFTSYGFEFRATWMDNKLRFYRVEVLLREEIESAVNPDGMLDHILERLINNVDLDVKSHRAINKKTA